MVAPLDATTLVYFNMAHLLIGLIKNPLNSVHRMWFTNNEIPSCESKSPVSTFGIFTNYYIHTSSVFCFLLSPPPPHTHTHTHSSSVP